MKRNLQITFLILLINLGISCKKSLKC